MIISAAAGNFYKIILRGLNRVFNEKDDLLSDASRCIYLVMLTM